MKTNKGLVEYAKAQLGKPYWYGSFGQLGTQSFYNQKKRQYPDYYQWSYESKDAAQKVHDCVGLIKGYLWCDSPTDTTPVYNGAQDKSANGMYEACKTKGAIGTMPDVPGTLVFMEHHVGVYIGNGEVIEARGHSYGVVKTKLQGRGWRNWGYCPYITYEASPEPKPATVKKITVELTQLSKGAKGEQVKTLQRLLVAYGFSVGGSGIDGDFGNATYTAVIAFQRMKGLEQDGIVGKATWSALLGA